MKLFLQGDIQIGKSTILRNALLPYEQHVAGLMVQRLFEDGAVCGFRACAVNGALPMVDGAYSDELNGVFLYKGQSFPAVLEETIMRAHTICAETACKFIVLDEIGGLELLSGAFMNSLEKILALNKPCAGVIKARRNLERMAGRLHLSPDILTLRDNLQKKIEADGRVLTMTEASRGETKLAVREHVHKSLAHGQAGARPQD